MGKSGGGSRRPSVSVRERAATTPRKAKESDLTRDLFAGRTVLVQSPKQGYYVMSLGKENSRDERLVKIYSAERIAQTQEYGKHQDHPLQQAYVDRATFNQQAHDMGLQLVSAHDTFNTAVNAARRTSDGIRGRLIQLNRQREVIQAAIKTSERTIADVNAGKLYANNAYDRARELQRMTDWGNQERALLAKTEAMIAKQTTAAERLRNSPSASPKASAPKGAKTSTAARVRSSSGKPRASRAKKASA